MAAAKRKTRADSRDEQNSKAGRPEEEKPEARRTGVRGKKAAANKTEGAVEKKPEVKKPETNRARAKRAKTEKQESKIPEAKKDKTEVPETKEPEGRKPEANKPAELPTPPSIVAWIIARAARENTSNASPARRIAASNATEYLVEDLNELAAFERKKLPKTTESEKMALAKRCSLIAPRSDLDQYRYQGGDVLDQYFTAASANKLFNQLEQENGFVLSNDLKERYTSVLLWNEAITTTQSNHFN